MDAERKNHLIGRRLLVGLAAFGSTCFATSVSALAASYFVGDAITIRRAVIVPKNFVSDYECVWRFGKGRNTLEFEHSALQYAPEQALGLVQQFRSGLFLESGPPEPPLKPIGSVITPLQDIGFFARSDRDKHSFYYQIGFPLWVLVLATAPFPICLSLIFQRRRQRHRRLENGLCPRCGYDCRATPGRCSECGFGLPEKSPS